MDLEDIEIDYGQAYFLDDEQVYFQGISDGVGTCSDIHGIDVAVFSKYGPDNFQAKSYNTCHSVVLLRSPYENEIDSSGNGEIKSTTLAVEGLKSTQKDNNSYHFFRNGKIKFYTNLI